MFLRRLLRLVASLALLLVVTSSLAAQSTRETAAFPRGVVISSVACADKPEHTYALYLPSAYTPGRRWPVLFAFDPLARGRVPVELFRDAAEKYGYIVAGSNNSRNGPYALQMEAADAMLLDASRRFSLDEKRIYTTGFSGGSRVATMFALLCKDCVAGVFAHSGGFPEGRVPSQRPPFVYFAAAGDLDFNYAEHVELIPRLDALGVPNRFRVFPGPHQWAPAEVCLEAVEWFELMAMKHGRRETDSAFLAAQFERASRKVRELENAEDLFSVWREVSKLAVEFGGLADTSAFSRRAAELKDLRAVRDAARREREAVAEQRRIVAPIVAALHELPGQLPEGPQAMMRLRSQISDLVKEAKNARDPQKALPLRRALTQLFFHAFEAGQDKLRTQDSSLAAVYFEISAELQPDSPRPLLLLARAHAQAGKKKETLRDLQQALTKGFSREALASYLRDNPEFASFLDQPEFRQLLSAPLEKQ